MPIRLSLAAFATTLLLSAAGFAQDIAPEQYSAIKGRHIGPVGNRVIAVVVVSLQFSPNGVGLGEYFVGGT